VTLNLCWNWCFIVDKYLQNDDKRILKFKINLNWFNVLNAITYIIYNI
jgi:hypothetical protein